MKQTGILVMTGLSAGKLASGNYAKQRGGGGGGGKKKMLFFFFLLLFLFIKLLFRKINRKYN